MTGHGSAELLYSVQHCLRFRRETKQVAVCSVGLEQLSEQGF